MVAAFVLWILSLAKENDLILSLHTIQPVCIVINCLAINEHTGICCSPFVTTTAFDKEKKRYLRRLYIIFPRKRTPD